MPLPARSEQERVAEHLDILDSASQSLLSTYPKQLIQRMVERLVSGAEIQPVSELLGLERRAVNPR
jgi:hypothetical protein